jgi:hypothetical protein
MRSNLGVTIVRYVDDHQPGWVESQFTDANGRCHTIIDKVPIFTAEDLTPKSTYPQPGQVRCDILSQSHDALGRMLARVSIADGVETTEGLTEFVVLSSLIPN